VAQSLLGGTLAAAGPLLALGLLGPVQREVEVLLSRASSLGQAAATSQYLCAALSHLRGAAGEENTSKAESPWVWARGAETYQCVL